MIRSRARYKRSAIYRLLGLSVAFDHNLAELMPLVEKEGAITQLEVKPSYVLFFKKPDAPGVANSTVNWPLKQLIELCDGTRTIDGVVSSISSQLGMTEADVRNDCWAALWQPYIGGAVGFVEEA